MAWHPAPAQTGLDQESPAPVTRATAGTLRLTVWPDTPVGEHQRYAYRITDTTSGREVEGRDLFTGAGQPVDPDHAIRDLATFLFAAGEARRYALDHPDSMPEHAGLFPEWVAEAARSNADGLTELTEPAELAPASEASRTGRQWISVVFLQGEEADQVLDVIDRDGTDTAIEHLAGYDYGEETTQAALENGYVYDEPPTGALDRLVTGEDGYTLTYNPFAGHVSLLRKTPRPPTRSKTPAWCRRGMRWPESAPPRPEPAPKQQAASERPRRAPDPSWFEHPGVAAVKQSRGLSL